MTNLLESLKTVTAVFETDTWRTQINELLENVAGSIHAERMLLFKMRYTSDGILVADALSAGHGQSPEKSFDGVSLRALGMDAIHDALKSGQTFVGPSSDFTTLRAATFFPTPVLCVLAPIVVNSQWWGFLRCDYPETYTFSGELEILNALAEAFSSYITRTEAEQTEAEQQANTQAIQAIVADTQQPADTRIEQLLNYGLGQLGLQIGIVSQIEGADYVVKFYAPAESGLSRGQVFDLGQTYCSITLKAGRTLGIAHMAISEYHRHPCYEAFRLESYIGVAIAVRGEAFGTVNFSGPNARTEPFSLNQQRLVEKIGLAVSGLLEQMN